METNEELENIDEEDLLEVVTDDALKMYIKNISIYPKLSIEEQKELFRRGETEKLINCNLRLVVKIALKYRVRAKHMKLLDIIQEGNLGLMRAIETYDPDQGAFTTYAVPWIKHSIRRSLDDKDRSIRLPYHLEELVGKYKRLLASFNSKGLEPTEEEIKDILGINDNKYKTLMEVVGQSFVSISQKIGEGDGIELENFIGKDEEAYDTLADNMVDNNLKIVLKTILNSQEYFIIYHRFLNDEIKTLDWLAKALGLSVERIRQKQDRCLRKIRPYMEENSQKYREALTLVRSRGNIANFKVEPISPLNILKYLYLKDELTEEERRVYELELLGDYYYTDKDYANILMVDKEELREIKKSLKAKIMQKFADKKAFKNYKEDKIKTYGSEIYSIFKIENVVFIDYQRLYEKYASLDYDTMITYFNEAQYELNKDELTLIERFYSKLDGTVTNKSFLEQAVNIIKFGFNKKEKHLSYSKLYTTYLKNKDIFSLDEQQFISMYIFNKDYDKALLKNNPYYKSKNLRAIYKHYYINQLEKLYYNIYRFSENTLDKKIWLKVKKQYKERLSEERILLLDLYFGVNDEPLSIMELSQMFHKDYDKLNDFIQKTLIYVRSLYIGRSNSLEINKKLYIPYVKKPYYDFPLETRNILKMFLIDNLSYEEIAKKTNLTKPRISNIITDGLRKCDYYRFNLNEVLIISNEELNNFFAYYEESFSEKERQVIKLKFRRYLNNDDIAKQIQISKQEVNRLIAHFNSLYYKYQIKDVKITRDDYINELNLHPSESVLTNNEALFISLSLGIKCSYNPDGIMLSKEELMAKFNLTINQYFKLKDNIKNKLKARKINLLKPFGYMDRKNLDNVLDDVHLPITKEDRELICYLFGLKGYPYLTIEELINTNKYDVSNLKRKYQRAIINIYKYLNKEIDGIIDYETDIEPYLKYFPLYEREKINDAYKDGLSYEKIAAKYNLTFNVVCKLMQKINFRLYELQNSKKAKQFDFEYYELVKNEPDLSYYGNVKLAQEVFALHFEECLTYPEIVTKLGLNCKSSVLSKMVYDLMLSVCKYKDGYRKTISFSYEEIKDYYERHERAMDNCQKQLYARYFKRVKGLNGLNVNIEPSYQIINDLIQERFTNASRLETATKSEVYALLKKHYHELTLKEKNSLMILFGISERDFMNGKDLKHVYKLLNTLDIKRSRLMDLPRTLNNL